MKTSFKIMYFSNVFNKIFYIYVDYFFFCIPKQDISINYITRRDNIELKQYQKYFKLSITVYNLKPSAYIADYNKQREQTSNFTSTMCTCFVIVLRTGKLCSKQRQAKNMGWLRLTIKQWDHAHPLHSFTYDCNYLTC